jgi:hypothetical protein
MTAVQGSILGNAVLRREDPSLLRGEDKYFDDMAVEGLAYVHFVRSTVAHATINSIDISDALEMPGVLAVHTADTLEFDPWLSFPLFPPLFARNLLAKGKVRFVGDIIAVVVADQPRGGRRRRRGGPDRLRPAARRGRPRGRPGGRRAHSVRGARLQPVLRDRHRVDTDPLAGAAHVAEVPRGQPAAGRRADGDQRHHRRARRRRAGSRCGPRPRTRCRSATPSPRSGPRDLEGAGRGSGRRRRVRSQGRPYIEFILAGPPGRDLGRPRSSGPRPAARTCCPWSTAGA